MPARTRPASREALSKALIPRDVPEVQIEVDGRRLKLTNLGKTFWLQEELTKGDLLRYYIDVSSWLLPHLAGRAMVMKRYPNGAGGPFFFQKRVPEPHPDWLETCSIRHVSASVIEFPIVRDLASLLWTINLGCIDLNPWYARCDDVGRPDYLHFDLDPVPGTGFEKVCETALLVHQALEALKMPNYAKTTGSRGIHVYVPIVRGPTQKQVWAFSKQLARSMEQLYPQLVTTEYRVANRPKGRVLVDYNQNAWGRTLASIYSVRPKPLAPVSTPVTWQEIKRGIKIEDYRLDNVPARLARVGDLWKPLLQPRGRFKLEKLL